MAEAVFRHVTAYCTAADVKVYVGTAVSDADLGAMIADSDDDIDDFFASRGGYTPSTTVAKQVSILLTRARVAERLNLTGEAPTAYSAADYSQSGVSDQMGQSRMLREEANKKMMAEIARLRTSATTQDDVRRCDAVMSDFKLDQTDDPVIGDFEGDESE